MHFVKVIIPLTLIWVAPFDSGGSAHMRRLCSVASHSAATQAGQAHVLCTPRCRWIIGRAATAVAGLLIVAVVNSVMAQTGQEKAAAFSSCFKNINCLDFPRTSWDFLVDDIPSCLSLSRVWWSAKPPGVAITLVTQLTTTRLDQLKSQCRTWRGPLAAALYLPLVNPGPTLTDESQRIIHETTNNVEQFFRATESDSNLGCQLRLALVYELYADNATAALLYPVNTLRNYARLMADTDLVTNIDVDLLPSLSISTALANPNVLANYIDSCRQGAVYVWPAFESHCERTEDADDVALAGKAKLLDSIRHCVVPFSPICKERHGPTQFERWYSSDSAYQINYAATYEPWFMSWRLTTEWFDFRYRGYGYNKIIQVLAMNTTGVKWMVSPHGFLIHRPHKHSNVKIQFLHEKNYHNETELITYSLSGHMLELWNTAEFDLKVTGRLDVRVEDSFRWCLKSLPWWKSVPHRSKGLLAGVSWSSCRVGCRDHCIVSKPV